MYYLGAGAGGASAAYYLNRYASESGITTRITVYERNHYIGGRSRTVNVYSQPSEPVELGASIFVPINRNLVSAAEKFGLKLSKKTEEKVDGRASGLGVWNGKEFVFTQDGETWKWWLIGKLLWRYGMSPLRTQNLVKSTLDTFMKMYEAPYFPFDSLSQTAHDLGLAALTSSTGEQVLQVNNIGRAFATEVIQASTRVNYGQNLPSIHGLETIVCMATDGAMAVAGGNWQIFAGMLDAADADVRLNRSVTGIERRADGGFIVHSEVLDGGDDDLDEKSGEEHFDTVVLAAPFQLTNIKISPALSRSPDTIPYVSLHVTLFTSPHRVSPLFFNLPADSIVPEIILTTVPPSIDEKPKELDFLSISLLRGVQNPNVIDPSTGQARQEYLYKIFSPQPLPPNSTVFLSALLGLDPSLINYQDDVPWEYHHHWSHAYPFLFPRITFEDIQLADTTGGLWYTSGMESFISTMETNSLAGMNVARLVVDHWLDDRSSLFSPSSSSSSSSRLVEEL